MSRLLERLGILGLSDLMRGQSSPIDRCLPLELTVLAERDAMNPFNYGLADGRLWI